MFNPDAQVTTMRFADRYVVLVIDDALLDPDGLVGYAGQPYIILRSNIDVFIDNAIVDLDGHRIWNTIAANDD